MPECRNFTDMNGLESEHGLIRNLDVNSSVFWAVKSILGYANISSINSYAICLPRMICKVVHNANEDIHHIIPGIQNEIG